MLQSLAEFSPVPFEGRGFGKKLKRDAQKLFNI